MMYLIPDKLREPMLNWAVYAAPPIDVALRPENPTSLPPGAIGAKLLDHFEVFAEAMPPYWRELLRRVCPESVLMQPIYDVVTQACAAGRLGLVGDAATVARPHTGGGVAKALQDAMTLQSALGQGLDWTDALRAYDEQRSPSNRSLVELGRTLGDATVLNAPDWRQMDTEQFASWWAAVMAGRPLGMAKIKG
jgi:2-polyprenyl-6-methoxyphenol hydroxylase-like FAD-dependent oxidoreductase